jgi:hypothetical protein
MKDLEINWMRKALNNRDEDEMSYSDWITAEFAHSYDPLENSHIG